MPRGSASGLIYEALNLLNHVIDIDSQNELAYYERAHVYEWLKNDGNAQKDYKKVIELNPQHKKAYLYLGFVFCLQSNFAQAEQTYLKAMEIDNNPQAYLYLANIYMNQDKVSEAEECFRKYLEYDSKGSVWIDLTQCLYNQQKYQEAIGYLKNVFSNEDCKESIFTNSRHWVDPTIGQLLEGQDEVRVNTYAIGYKLWIMLLIRLNRIQEMNQVIEEFRKYAADKRDAVIIKLLESVYSEIPEEEKKDITMLNKACF